MLFNYYYDKSVVVVVIVVVAVVAVVVPATALTAYKSIHSGRVSLKPTFGNSFLLQPSSASGGGYHFYSSGISPCYRGMKHQYKGQCH